jgi:hypothetical protein
MALANYAAGALLIVSISTATAHPAAAETQLTDFNGTWRGNGNDRYTPLESMQRTVCQTSVNADLRRMRATTKCDGSAGLSKSIQLDITLNGNAFSGTLTQTTRIGGGTPSVLSGSVSGQKTDNTAQFGVTFPGLVPSVTVALRLTSPSSYTMQATTLGGALMDVAFNRTSRR